MSIVDIKQAHPSTGWSVEQSRDLYRVPWWSEGYFDINKNGHLSVHPRQSSGPEIDLHELAMQLRRDGTPLPVLLRFTDILQHRVDALCRAFGDAMQEQEYRAAYTAVYPIKVNQQRKVVEDIIHYGGKRIGLEAGSKPELLTVLALSGQGNTIICNGYKDREYIRLAMIGQQLGLRVFIVIEKLSELHLVIQTAREMGLTPRLGIRVRLASIAAGKWQNTGGEKSKFGLHSAEVIRAINKLADADMLECLQLLHFHVGSQVSNIQHFQKALREGARYYAELREMQAPVSVVDVGGGLGIDYEGSLSENYCSMNYSMQRYADTVVHAFAEACRENDLPQAEIITESGRAMTAHHALLITNLIDWEQAQGLDKPRPPGEIDPAIVNELWQLLVSLDDNNAVTAYHDATHYYNESREMFILGLLNLEHRARIEESYFAICRSVLERLPSEQAELRNHLTGKLADKYFFNFSLFQSIPDSWAIDQIFPILPLHRLDEEPDRRTVIQDLTCDSDGSIDLYLGVDGPAGNLPLHQPRNQEPYLIGILLLGAYQEILGDMHNLFGDTASVNVELNDSGKFRLTEYHHGDNVADLLDYVHIDGKQLQQMFSDKIRTAGLPEPQQSDYLNELIQGLEGYTYLED